MPTPIWSATAETIERCAALLRGGRLVAFPTETVYGLGANALDAAAVAHIFEAKGRPSTNPVIVHVPTVEAARTLTTHWTVTAEQLATAFWPGPLTLVVPKAACVPDIVTAGGPTVALRHPRHPVAQVLLEAVGCPLAAPSANRSTELSPTLAEHVFASLDGRIDAILDGGPCRGGIESTVVDVSTDDVRILRPGLVSQAMIESIVDRTVSHGVASQGASQGASQDVARSPGQMAKHYAPRTPLLLASRDEANTLRGPGVHVLDLGDDPARAAEQLYATLHELDAVGWQRIVVISPPPTHEWAAIRDRLTRAATDFGERDRGSIRSQKSP
jgi:L-threonylcarbamoyladenylate synthase